MTVYVSVWLTVKYPFILGRPELTDWPNTCTWFHKTSHQQSTAIDVMQTCGGSDTITLALTTNQPFTPLHLPSSSNYKGDVYNMQLTAVWEDAARHEVH